MLWYIGIGGALGALGPNSILALAQYVKIWHCRSCGLGCTCSSDLIPDPKELHTPEKQNRKFLSREV